jgi:hypothetical protein
MAYAKSNPKGSTLNQKKLTREDAYEILRNNGIDFDKSYYGAFLSKGFDTAYAREHLLDTLARATGYKKPTNTSRSVGFFNHLKEKYHKR